jgi:hypothetical protein
LAILSAAVPITGFLVFAVALAALGREMAVEESV